MPNTVEHYLSKRFDRKTAEYFAAGKKRIVGVEPNDNFTLTISFDNGEKRLYDVRPLLKKGTVFEPFIKPEKFRRVYVDDTHCVAWDIDPASRTACAAALRAVPPRWRWSRAPWRAWCPVPPLPTPSVPAPLPFR